MSNHPRPAPSAAHLALADRLLAVEDEGGPRDGRRPSRLPAAAEIGALAEDLITVLFPEVGRAGPAVGPGDLRGAVAGALAALEPHLDAAIFSGIHRRCRSDEDQCRERA